CNCNLQKKTPAMPVICLGPICIPWTAIWPLLLFLWRPIRTTFLKYFNPELL
ncbi:unnamed protein product, partial [Heterosigma akashiwo]